MWRRPDSSPVDFSTFLLVSQHESLPVLHEPVFDSQPAETEATIAAAKTVWAIIVIEEKN